MILHMPNLPTRRLSSQQRSTLAEQGDSDGDEVVFQVGLDDRIRVAARKSVLCAHNEVFHAMFCGPYSQAHDQSWNAPVASNGCRKSTASVCYINEPDLDGRAFVNLIKFLHGETIKLQTVTTAVETLHTAQKYLCAGLLEICVNYLTSQLRVWNVLQIFQCIRAYVKTRNPDALTLYQNQNQPNAPSLQMIENSPEWDPCARLPTQLLINCLEFIDKNASAVLGTEDFEKLDVEAVEFIITRDELVVKNETEVWAAIVRWATFQCLCRQIPDNTENRHCLMDRLKRHVRFSRMSSKELKKIQLNSHLFTPDEYSLLLSHAKGKESYKSPSLPIIWQTPFIAKPRNYILADKREQTVQPDANKKIIPHIKNNFTKKLFSCLLFFFE